MSQFDSSVLAMREEDNRSSGTNSQPRYKEQAVYKEETPRYLAYEDYYPDSNKQVGETPPYNTPYSTAQI